VESLLLTEYQIPNLVWSVHIIPMTSTNPCNAAVCRFVFCYRSINFLI
jgi:hypothetical protein